ncbi:porin [Oryzicola mucosus]|uniref:Porin n=1 Tax=Oryzicola mucosus TaxID=2767425 RepID=A0A8J6U5A4_9HYPH|nr:porin [Oryzicola mucosus]MBD0415855.1 porin [Oryzicola mucosus]
MNIKSLLLGSAAALLAVSGARAADAIVVAEPEPMEYVRICDVYGAGFYYIPGTETCLKIGGLVRYQINWADNDDGWRKEALMRLKIDARSETEYGTFRRYIEFQASANARGWVEEDGVDYWTGASDESGTALRHAYFELGGLLVGHTDTLFDGDLSGEFDTGGGERVNQIRYTFDAGNGIAVSLGLEEESNDYDYVPLIVGKVSIAQGWGSVDLFAGYDNAYEEFALKGIAKIKATEALTIELLAAYESGPTYWGFGNPIVGISSPYDGYEWSAGGYLMYQVNEKLAIGAGGQYFADAHSNGLLDGIADVGGNNDWVVGAVVDYKIVENLDAKLALNYNDGDTYDEYNDGDGVFSGFLRLDASF